MLNFNLNNKVAIVTGGNGGIGLAIALGLSEFGANVVITGRNKKKNHAAAQLIKKRGGDALCCETDIRNITSCQQLFKMAYRKFGKIDILINNAGVTIRKPPDELTLDDWKKVIDTNLTGAFLCSQTSYKYFLESGAGKIINIGSMLTIFGMPMSAAYGASKGGIVQLGRSLATAWAKDNIQVNSILPGWIDTDMAASSRAYTQTLHEKILQRTPAQRWGIPSDISGLAVFLSSSASDFITGTAIPVDGGYSISG